jgi:hypothetical protein
VGIHWNLQGTAGPTGLLLPHNRTCVRTLGSIADKLEFSGVDEEFFEPATSVSSNYTDLCVVAPTPLISPPCVINQTDTG